MDYFTQIFGDEILLFCELGRREDGYVICVFFL